MKKLFVPALAVVLLSSCSDKNDRQPKLGAASRTPVNQPMANPMMGGMTNMPQMIGSQNAMPQTGFMDMTGGQPMPNQAEVFLNDQVAFGTAPSALGNKEVAIPSSANIIPNTPAAPALNQTLNQATATAVLPVSTMKTPVNTGKTGYLPPEVTGSNLTGQEPTVTYVTNRRNVPASLLPTYKNPLNLVEEEAPQNANPVQPMMQMPPMGMQPQMPMMQQPQMGQVAPVFNLPPQPMMQQMPVMPMQNMQMPPMGMGAPMQQPMPMMGQPMMQQPQMGQPQQQDPMWQPPMMLPAQLN